MLWRGHGGRADRGGVKESLWQVRGGWEDRKNESRVGLRDLGQRGLKSVAIYIQGRRE